MNSLVTLRLDWPSLIAGFLLGGLAAYAAHAFYDGIQMTARASHLHKKYGKLARSYANYRPDGNATDGLVELTQQKDGSFKIVGLSADRTVEWESALWMDEKFENHGTAHYRYKPGNNYGVQFIRYSPETEELYVRAVRESSGPRIGERSGARKPPIATPLLTPMSEIGIFRQLSRDLRIQRPDCWVRWGATARTMNSLKRKISIARLAPTSHSHISGMIRSSGTCDARRNTVTTTTIPVPSRTSSRASYGSDIVRAVVQP